MTSNFYYFYMYLYYVCFFIILYVKNFLIFVLMEETLSSLYDEFERRNKRLMRFNSS